MINRNVNSSAIMDRSEQFCLGLAQPSSPVRLRVSDVPTSEQRRQSWSRSFPLVRLLSAYATRASATPVEAPTATPSAGFKVASERYRQATPATWPSRRDAGMESPSGSSRMQCAIGHDTRGEGQTPDSPDGGDELLFSSFRVCTPNNPPAPFRANVQQSAPALVRANKQAQGA